MKTIALYVPQYHPIPLNDKYWGKGFTEWVNVKNAKPLFEGHNQPRIPLNNNYYNLLDRETKKWQIELAKKYGIYGFCFYHYWFNGEKLLEKPAEQILEDKTLNIPFCFSWANEAWSMEWVGKNQVIMPQFYGEKKEWKEHFDYLLPFFKDERYIKENGKPLFVIYRPGSINCLSEMIKYWRELAKEAGFPDLVILNQNPDFMINKKVDHSQIDYDIEFEPATSKLNMYGEKFKLVKSIRHRILDFTEKRFGWDLRKYGQNLMAKATNSQFPSYDATWENILQRKPYSSKSIPTAFVDWDNSPRYKKKARVYIGASPKKFGKYFSRLIKKTKDEYKKDMMFIMAWNEWGEGGYLEPDTTNGYGYLQEIKKALEDNNEFPNY